MKKTFGETLKGLRKRAGKSQSEVAREINDMFADVRMSQTTLSELENQTLAPRESILRVLATYYNVHIGIFFCDDNYIGATNAKCQNCGEIIWDAAYMGSAIVYCSQGHANLNTIGNLESLKKSIEIQIKRNIKSIEALKKQTDSLENEMRIVLEAMEQKDFENESQRINRTLANA